ncbi:hypothetical protein OSB04_009888 [Centaurea solstitialis]|uniref:Cysteine alpha-hairpin motif superfamily n=1 Tax=Centaurea solstitialis TaxID=347529 RepID=A0AA38WMK4_9ASTR|nr:hypothetical protein OSB04_009888 [Centaurea solstitialis]
MEKSEAVCGQEALELLNCIASSSFDQEKCITLLNSLRKCVLDKKVKKFSLAEEKQEKIQDMGKKQA